MSVWWLAWVFRLIYGIWMIYPKGFIPPRLARLGTVSRAKDGGAFWRVEALTMGLGGERGFFRLAVGLVSEVGRWTWVLRVKVSGRRKIGFHSNGKAENSRRYCGTA